MIVSCLDLRRSFSKEGEGYLSPLRVSPMSPNDERNHAVTIGVYCLDGEEKIGAVLAFEIIDGWVREYLPIATPGAQEKGVARV